MVAVTIACGNPDMSPESSQNQVPTSIPFAGATPTSSISSTPTQALNAPLSPPSEPTAVPVDVEPSSSVGEVSQLVEGLMQTGVEATYREGGPLIRYPTILGVVLLGQGDEVIANVARGLADVDQKNKMFPGTRFPLGAISDLFSVTAILQLHEEGKLNLDAPIGTVITDFPQGDKVSLYHLITHTSGLPHIGDLRFDSDDKSRRATDIALDHLAGRELRYDPGTKLNATGGDSPTPTDYLMVRYVIEQVSGQSYEQYLDEHVFRRAGMANTVIAKADVPVENRALGYTVGGRTDGRAPTQVDQEQVPRSSDDGLIVWSTGEDLFRWYRALINGELVGSELVERMFTPALKLSGNSGHVGYGWTIQRTAFGYTTFQVANLTGYNVEVRTIPDEDLFVVVLTYIEDFFPPRGQISWQLATLALR